MVTDSNRESRVHNGGSGPEGNLDERKNNIVCTSFPQGYNAAPSIGQNHTLSQIVAECTKTVDNKLSILENKLNTINHKVDTLQKDVDIIKNKPPVPRLLPPLGCTITILNTNSNSASGSSSNSSPDVSPKNNTSDKSCPQPMYPIIMSDACINKVAQWKEKIELDLLSTPSSALKEASAPATQSSASGSSLSQDHTTQVSSNKKDLGVNTTPKQKPEVPKKPALENKHIEVKLNAKSI